MKSTIALARLCKKEARHSILENPVLNVANGCKPVPNVGRVEERLGHVFSHLEH